MEDYIEEEDLFEIGKISQTQTSPENESYYEHTKSEQMMDFMHQA
jgi:hypothetical protein